MKHSTVDHRAGAESSCGQITHFPMGSQSDHLTSSSSFVAAAVEVLGMCSMYVQCLCVHVHVLCVGVGRGMHEQSYLPYHAVQGRQRLTQPFMVPIHTRGSGVHEQRE